MTAKPAKTKPRVVKTAADGSAPSTSDELRALQFKVQNLERELKILQYKVDNPNGPPMPWWEQISGAFEGDPAYEEAMRLGREYRESFRPKPRKRKKQS